VLSIKQISGFRATLKRLSAHKIYYDLTAKLQDGSKRNGLLKLNKFQGLKGEQASELEAAFTCLANVFGSNKHQLYQHIVRNNAHIVGVYTEHAAYVLHRLKLQNPSLCFYHIPQFPNSEELELNEFESYIKRISLLNTELPTGQSFQSENEANISFEDFSNWIDLQEICEAYNLPAISRKALKNYFECCYQLLQDGQKYNPTSLSDIYKELHEPAKHFKLYEKIYIELKKIYLKKQTKTPPAQQQPINVSALYPVGNAIQFLDHAPQNFFSNLIKLKNLRKIEIDMDSLADILTVAYTLEEDDLHKGNIGYYVTQSANGVPKFHFFKIDHDLLFSEKIMSHKGFFRSEQFFSSSKKWHITRSDLTRFPDIHSGNHYWPTKLQWHKQLLNLTKAYNSEHDRQTFIDLNEDTDFNFQKWKNFLKHTLLPTKLLVDSLKQELNGVDPDTMGTVSLIQRSTLARISELRTVLLTTPEFRTMLRTKKLQQEMLEYSRQEITESARDLGYTATQISHINQTIQTQFNEYLYIIDNDITNPIEIAIRTNSYRPYETPARFSHELKKSYTPTLLDTSFKILLALLKTAPDNKKKIQYYADVIEDLLIHHAPTKEHNIDTIQSTIQELTSLSQIEPVNSLEEFYQSLSDLRDRDQASLKQDKVAAVKLLEKANLNQDALTELQHQLSQRKPKSPLMFIKELRSELWLVRKFRGAYGSTTTSKQMHQLIHVKLEALKKNASENNFKDTP
jgi:hypothetical protein